MTINMHAKPLRGMYGGVALGVDPGLAHCGFAVVIESPDGKMRVAHTHLVNTVKEADKALGIRVSDDDTRRMILIQRACVKILGEQKPTLVGIECYSPLAGKQGNGAFKVATIYGLVHGLATSANRPVYGNTPQDLRRAFLGSAKGTKQDIEAAVTHACAGVAQALSAYPKSQQEHIADAIAHAVYVLDQTRATRKIAQARRKRITVAYEVEGVAEGEQADA